MHIIIVSYAHQFALSITWRFSPFFVSPAPSPKKQSIICLNMFTYGKSDWFELVPENFINFATIYLVRAVPPFVVATSTPVMRIIGTLWRRLDRDSSWFGLW